MENNNKRVVDNRQNINDDEKMKINMRAELDEHYTMLKECPKCGTRMIYAYGEVYECPKCGNKEFTEFGKIRDYLEKHGPQNAVTIADATGVSVKTIQKFLYQGRIEIPDGSGSYIKCQMCGAEIRYGRFCPECSAKLSRDNSSMVYVGEKPKHKMDYNGKMHTLDERFRISLLDAVRQLDKKPRVLLIGSGEEYGHIKEGECPIVEDNTVRPGNIYAATKACQNMLGKIYSDAYGLDIMMVRAFNHIGPNQTPMFVVADFCKQVADIEKGRQEPVIYVGNLSAKRDFTDVRDVVKAYALLVEHGRRGETYNVGTGHAIAISQILDEIVAMSDTAIEVKVDENKLRPVDVPIIEPDIDKIKSEVGWQPVISLEQTLKETLEHWRSVDIKGY